MDLDNVLDEEIYEELEEEFDDGIITLKNEAGEEVDFRNIAGIALDSGFYVIMQPVELYEDMEEDEALVFQVTEDEDANAQYTIVFDDEIVEAVFNEYDRLYDEALDNQLLDNED